ncbi:MAG: alpha/beta hydrolase [Ilumatobacteraceae bacterium]
MIWSEEAGEAAAPLVVLIHGAMDRSTSMLRLSRRLEGRFRVLRYDRRGYGRSQSDDAPDGPFGVDAQLADLVALLAGRRALLVGHSYGGDVALATAARHPELIAGISVYEAPLSWASWWPRTTAGAEAVATAGNGSGSAEDAAENAAEQFMRRLIGDAAWDALPVRTRTVRRAEGAALVGELRDLQAGQPWRDTDVRCPVVLGFGARGADHHKRGMGALHDLFPQSLLEELAECRHDAPNSHPQLFVETLVEPLAMMAGEPWSVAVNPSEPRC